MMELGSLQSVYLFYSGARLPIDAIHLAASYRASEIEFSGIANKIQGMNCSRIRWKLYEERDMQKVRDFVREVQGLRSIIKVEVDEIDKGITLPL